MVKKFLAVSLPPEREYMVGPDASIFMQNVNAPSPREAAEKYAEELEGELEWDDIDTTILRVMLSDGDMRLFSRWRVEREVLACFRARPAPEEVSP